jgi:hypothetical protein
MRAIFRLRFLAPLLSALLFLLLFPVLDIFTHPVSVLYGSYIPLVIRLSDIYWDTSLLSIAVLGTPLLLVALLLLAQWQGLGLPRTSVCVLAPFSLALLFQYFIAVGLDKYLVEFPAAGLPIPWGDVFQPQFILGCLLLLLVYACLAIGLWMFIFTIRGKIATALTKG